MNRSPLKTSGRFAALAAALAFAATPMAAIVATPAAAQSASAKSAVDTAKAKGIVGEQGDGYLGLVTGSADAATKAAMAEINAGRTGAYQAAAAKAGVSVQAAAEATARQLFAKMPAGQYYKPVGGAWTRK